MNPRLVNKRNSHRAYLVCLGVVLAGISRGFAANGDETRFGLYKSTDQGASWFQAGQGLPSDARLNVLSMAGEVAVAGTDRGVFISRDSGTKWLPALKGVGTECRVLCFTTHAGRVLAGTQNHGVVFSDDEGTSWKPTNLGLADRYIRSLVTTGTRLYAGTDSLGVFVSENAGTSWTNQRAGLPDLSQVFDLASLGGTVFAGLYSKGLYRWDTERGLWEMAGAVSPLEVVTVGETLVVGHNPGGVFVSEDQGSTWLDGNVGLPVNAPTWTLAADDARVWLGTSGKVGFAPEEIGLYVSQDRGRSWTSSDAGLPASSAVVSFLITKRFLLAGIVVREFKGDLPSR